MWLEYGLVVNGGSKTVLVSDMKIKRWQWESVTNKNGVSLPLNKFSN